VLTINFTSLHGGRVLPVHETCQYLKVQLSLGNGSSSVFYTKYINDNKKPHFKHLPLDQNIDFNTR